MKLILKTIYTALQGIEIYLWVATVFYILLELGRGTL